MESKLWSDGIVINIEEVDMKKACIGMLLLMTGVLAANAQTAAVVREISGTVEVKAPGAAEWTKAATGQELDAAYLVSTGFKSTALIMIGNSAVTVRSLTRLSLEEIVANQNSEQVTLNLRAGRIRANVKPPSGGQVNFSVKSPTATASVRGTEFEFDGIQLRVDEGRVHLGGERATGVYISAGHSTAADPETGSAAAVLEVVKEDLSPALPAGVDAAPELPAAVPASAGLGIGLDW
jgi:hypothetical protein